MSILNSPSCTKPESQVKTGLGENFLKALEGKANISELDNFLSTFLTLKENIEQLIEDMKLSTKDIQDLLVEIEKREPTNKNDAIYIGICIGILEEIYLKNKNQNEKFPELIKSKNGEVKTILELANI
ncbi:MAG: hypothetical protein PHZ26_01060 [Candidatus Gracilibacteria bacterium]|nr:hypothetical protein [Candidatus Gracilibacteria bacterium]MDD2908324.1 hypothetical protein [Candidatus Gracilibacteria bacterium]